MVYFGSKNATKEGLPNIQSFVLYFKGVWAQTKAARNIKE